jgi:hypothetical protein
LTDKIGRRNGSSSLGRTIDRGTWCPAVGLYLRYHVDARRMVVGILPYKREQILDTLTCWKTKTEFTLKEVSSLHGTLESLSRYNRWGRAWFFALQNAIRDELIKRYHILERWFYKNAKCIEESTDDSVISKTQLVPWQHLFFASSLQ